MKKKREAVEYAIRNGNGGMNSRLLAWTLAIVGALSAVLWGIVWQGLSTNTHQAGELSTAYKVLEVKIQTLDRGQTDIVTELKEIKAELKNIRRNP